MKYIFHSLICIFLVSSCKNDGGTMDPTWSNKGFQGITQTVDSPTPVGWIDPDDWKSDGYWNSTYPMYPCAAGISFKQSPIEIDTSVHPIDTPTSNKVYPAYPNPCSPGTSIEFELAQMSVVYMAVIDDQYRTVAPLVCGRQLGAGTYMVTWNGAGASGHQVPGDVYRVIILVTDQQGGMMFASHGDIWVK